MRLHKYLAICGVASRRQSEELIKSGKIKVNDKIVTQMGCEIDVDKDEVKFNDTIIIKEEKIYILLNKPEGYISTVNDQFNRKSILDLLDEVKCRIYPVGRLDYNSCGLLLLTNDGDLAYKLTHPKNHVEKTYIVKIIGRISEINKEKFESGLVIDGYLTKPTKLKIIDSNDDFSIIKITLYEGRNRQIRKMLQQLGYEVASLERIKIGSLEDKNLKKGEYRFLTEKEIELLRSN